MMSQKSKKNRNRESPTLPSARSCVPILTTVQPMALAELRQRVWFSFFSHKLSSLLVLIARSSMVPGTAKLMSLLDQKAEKDWNQIRAKIIIISGSKAQIRMARSAP